MRVGIWPFGKKPPPPYVHTSAEIDAYLKELRRQREAGELTRAVYDELRTQPPPPPTAEHDERRTPPPPPCPRTAVLFETLEIN